MRLLLGYDAYPPVIGGAERHVQTLARGLVRRGHHVAVVTQGHPGSPATDDDRGVRVHRVDGWGRHLARFNEAPSNRLVHPPVPDPGLARAIRRIVRLERPEVVDVGGWMLYSALLGADDVPVVSTQPDYGPACARKDLQQGGVRACSGPAAAKCLACTREHYGALKGAVTTSGLFASRRLHRRVRAFAVASNAVRDVVAPVAEGAAVVVLPPGLPAFAHDPAAAPRPAFLPERDGYLMFAGALGPHKGLDVLLEAHRRLADRVELLVVGTRRADSPPLGPGVHAAHDVPNHELLAGWAHCSVAVVPSVWPEPYGLVALEAMACGRPVVASDTGGLRDVVGPDCGILVPPGDADALTAALTGLLDDPARAEALGAAGRARALPFMGDRAVEAYERFYAEAAAGGGVTVGAGDAGEALSERGR